MKADLWLHAALRNADNQENKEERRKIAQGLAGIPIKQLYDEILWLEKTVLPAVETKSGKDHPHHRHICSVIDCLIWAVAIADRYEHCQVQNSRLTLLAEFYREQSELMQKELLKYTTLEDLSLSTSLDRYQDAVKKRIQDLTTKK